jgi:hypothetical protein
MDTRGVSVPRILRRDDCASYDDFRDKLLVFLTKEAEDAEKPVRNEENDAPKTVKKDEKEDAPLCRHFLRGECTYERSTGKKCHFKHERPTQSAPPPRRVQPRPRQIACWPTPTNVIWPNPIAPPPFQPAVWSANHVQLLTCSRCGMTCAHCCN